MTMRTASGQRGIVSLIGALLLLTLIGLVLVMGLRIAGTDVADSAAQNQSVEALMLAESGLERAAYNYSVSGACTSVGLGGTATNALGNGSFMLVTSASPVRPLVSGSNCIVRASGTVRNVTRTVDGWLSTSAGGAITFDYSNNSRAITNSLTFAHTVGATAKILLVGVSTNNANAAPTVTYSSQSLTQLILAGTGVGNPGTWIFYLLNPSAGSANVVVTLASSMDVVAGSVSLNGVSTTNPFDVAAVAVTQNAVNNTSRSITPVTAGAWVFEVVASEGGKAISPNPLLGIQTVRWNLSQGSVTGAASTLGPISPAATVTPSWKTTGGDSVKWAQVAAALRPGGGGPQLVRWSEVVN